MRRLLSLLTLTACVALLQAATLTQSQALQRAQLYMSKNTPMRVQSAAQQGRYELAHTAINKAGEADIYVFNRSGEAGYMLVAADDVAVPVLGYADAGSFNEQDVPDGLQYWLGEYQRQLEYLKQHPEQARSAQATATAVKPLLTCNWNQSAPYNNNCPIYSGTTHCVTGCVATATAQIMYYHKWPQRGNGSHSYTTRSNGYNLSANFSNSTYDWANMVDNYGSSNTSVQNAAVAMLMSDVGISVDMDYGQSSGAFSPDVAVALPTYFGYDKSIQVHNRPAYSVSVWERLIRDELDARRPVYYSGQATSGGHAFVCDGYDKEGYFHFNWGWGGKSNGYFILSILNPRDQGIGSFEGGYNSSQTIITHIMPDQGGQPIVAPSVGTVSISSSVSSVALGSAASFTVNNICMSGNKDWTESLYWFFAVTEPDVNVTTFIDYDYVVDASSIICGNSYSLESPTFTPSADLQDGKYYVRYAYQKDGVSRGFFTGINASDYIVDMEVKNGRAYFSSHADPINIVASDIVASSNPVYKDNTFSVKFKVSNNGSADYYNKVYIALMKGTTVSHKSDGISLGIAAGASVNLNFDMTASVNVGDYQLAILDANGVVVGSIPLTVADSGGTSTLQLVTNVTPGAAEMPANDVRATAVIKNTGGVFSGKIQLYILYESGNGGYYISNTLNSPIVTLKKGETATVNFQGEFAGSVGSTYYLGLPNPASTSAQLWSSIVPFTVCEDKPSIVGDVNGDGDVDIADINSVVSIILQQKQASDFVGNADLNNDGDIDIADINAIVSIILNK